MFKTSTDPSALVDAFTYSVTDTPFSGNPANTVTAGLIYVNFFASFRADGMTPFLSQAPLIGTGAANNILNIIGSAGYYTINAGNFIEGIVTGGHSVVGSAFSNSLDFRS